MALSAVSPFLYYPEHSWLLVIVQIYVGYNEKLFYLPVTENIVGQQLVVIAKVMRFVMFPGKDFVEKTSWLLE